MKYKYSHGIPIEYDLPPGPLWAYKHTIEELAELERADAYNHSAQFLQDPHQKGGSIFLTEWWEYYVVLPDYEYTAIFCDTALKKGQHNDYTVFQCWAKWRGRIYLVDQFRGKLRAADLKQKLIEFWNKHKGTPVQPCRGVYVEDKASGIQLIQDIHDEGGLPIIPVPRHESKIFRSNNLVNWIKARLLHLPKNVSWLYDYKNEFEKISPLGTHKYDDQVDATLDAIEHMLVLDTRIIEAPTQERGKSIAPGKNDKLW